MGPGSGQRLDPVGANQQGIHRLVRAVASVARERDVGAWVAVGA
jgi:hypothetical protein